LESVNNGDLEKIKGVILINEPMQNHTYLRIGGQADIMVIPRNVEDIVHVIAYAEEKGLHLCVVGDGSKLLVDDSGIRGIVIKIANTFNDVAVVGESVIAGAGCMLSRLLKTSREHALGGLEFATGIPGTVGGAIVMNAGTHIGSMCDVVDKVTVMTISDRSIKELSNEECHFGIRASVFQDSHFIVLQAKLNLKKGNPNEIDEKITALVEKRKKSQPLNLPSAGCIFKNPLGKSTGELVDKLGLKGLVIGHAQISKVHANFIVNVGGAKAQDVLGLMQIMQERVQDTFGIKLEPEIRILGNVPNAFKTILSN
jgi:UDP-N-acetylmuramate dehydrogenase